MAHDHRKQALLEWVESHKTILAQHQLYATGTTGNLIQRASGIPVTSMLSGPHGRRSAGWRIDCGRQDRHADLLLGSAERGTARSDVKALLRLATVWNIRWPPTARPRTFLIDSPLFKSEVEIAIPDYQRYLQERLK